LSPLPQDIDLSQVGAPLPGDAPAQQPGPVAPQQQASAQDSLAAFAKSRADARAQLAQAQGNAALAHRWADVGASFVRGGDLIAGRATNEDALKAEMDRAGQPVTDLMQQRASDMDATRQAEADVGLQGAVQKQGQVRDSLDPNSELSKQARMLAQAQGMLPPSYQGDFSASMLGELEKGATLAQAKAHQEAALSIERSKMNQAASFERDRMKQEGAALDEHKRHNQTEESFQGQKELPPNVDKEISALISGAQGLDELDAARKKSGFLGNVADKLGFGDLHAVKSGVAGEVAKADSRGNANPAAAARLESQLPGGFDPGGDTNIATRKAAMLNQAAARIAELKSGRYNPAQIQVLEGQLAGARGAAPDAGLPANVKVINGKTYEQLHNGQWIEH
jgi:hypothetical protein